MMALVDVRPRPPRRLVSRPRQMSLVAEESPLAPAPPSGPRDRHALYVRRMERLKQTLEGMGDVPRRRPRVKDGLEPPAQPGQDPELVAQESRRSSGLAPLRTDWLDQSEATYRSRDPTRLSSRETVEEAVSRGNTGTAGLYPPKYRAKALLKRKKKQGFIQTFPKLSKFVCILLSLWKKHQRKVKDFLDESVALVSVDQINDLLFDKTDYTADKQARISTDTKRILSKLPQLRTPKEIKYVEVALRNYPSIAAYPVSIQTLIASKAWYEIYHGRRIIIRQGHVARCFYFVLSGTAVVTKMDEGSSKSRTVHYLGKGDSFGEYAIINHTTRTATVISEGTVELLVVADEDYEEIFTSGELTERYYPFLRGLNYLKGWPLDLLYNNTSKAYITYSKRGGVISENSNETNSIYIVKSGSITVLKKLKEPQNGDDIARVKKKRLVDSLPEEDHLAHLCATLTRETRRLSRKEMAARYLRLRELHLGAHITGAVTRNTPGKDAIEQVMMLNSAQPAMPQPAAVELVGRMKRMSGWQMGPMVTRTGLNPLNPLPPVDESRQVDRSEDSRPLSGALSGTGSGDTSSNQTRRVSMEVPQHEEPPEERYADSFVTVQTLIKGDSFGIAELIHGPQPEFSLVSNGAELIVIDKKLYWEHAVDSQKLMRRLKNDILPYPTDDKMQTDLGVAVSWQRHKKKVFHTALRLARKRKAINKMKAKGLAVFVSR